MTDLQFISLFVSDLSAATARYTALLGREPVPAEPPVPNPHPYSPGPPVVFDLGQVKLALYAVDRRVTHPGDIALGLVSDDPAKTIAAACEHGAQAMPGPAVSVVVTPDRHFNEVVKRG